VVLLTDTADTIRPVVDLLRRQTVRDRLELVILAPEDADLEGVALETDGFAAVRTVTGSLDHLERGRAAGVRAATAPLVFLGETHSFPQPGWAEAVLAASHGPWGVVTCAMGNANPSSPLSWAAYLADYGRWGEGGSDAEIREAPLWNVTYRRDDLLALGDRLEEALSFGDELPLALRARGVRYRMASGARLDHLNVSRPGAWLDERFLSGLLVGDRRARRWSPLRRALYVAASPAIAAVLLRRALPGYRRAARLAPLPRGTLPALAVGTVVRTAGEVVGYVRGAGDRAQARMEEYELHKARYAP
jgi:hypothetical protein